MEADRDRQVRGAPGPAGTREVVLELLRGVRENGVVPGELLGEGFRCFTPLHDWLEGDEGARALAVALGAGGNGRPDAEAPVVVIAGEDAAVVELALGAGAPEGADPGGADRRNAGPDGADRGRAGAPGSPCTAAFLLEGGRVVEARCYLDPSTHPAAVARLAESGTATFEETAG